MPRLSASRQHRRGHQSWCHRSPGRPDRHGGTGRRHVSPPAFRVQEGRAREDDSVHPLHYLPYANTANVARFRLDRCNFSRVGTDDRRAVRLRFRPDRREGDVQGVDVELRGRRVPASARHVRVDFDDRATIVSDKGDEHAFNARARRGGLPEIEHEGRRTEHSAVRRDHQGHRPEFERVTLQVLDAKNELPTTAEFPLPTLEAGAQPVNSRVGFESQTFPPRGWDGGCCLAMSAGRIRSPSSPTPACSVRTCEAGTGR